MKEYKTVAALLESPERWTNDFNTAMVSNTQFCVATAINVVYGSSRCCEVAERFRLAVCPTQSLGDWNDSHTHAEVLAAVRKAGI